MSGVIVHGDVFAIKKYNRYKDTVSWTYHSKYKRLDVWRACTVDRKKRMALYKVYVAPGEIAVGYSYENMKDFVKRYMEGAARDL